jgi:hypothetical protein
MMPPDIGNDEFGYHGAYRNRSSQPGTPGLVDGVPTSPLGHRMRARTSFETKVYTCVGAFDRSKPVLYATRPDGSWRVLCGDEHPDDPSEYRVVGRGHVVGHHPALLEVLDLNPDEEAERAAVSASWARSRF